MSDTSTGDKASIGIAADHIPNLHFSTNTAEFVSVPESTTRTSRQNRYDEEIRNNGEINLKLKELGPGEQLKESPSSMLRSMQEDAQDIDGLPWEVRWKKQLIPTHEEAIQDLRDRFELYEPDAIAREEMWYLHWKDRGYSIAKDRLIWPQGYTDYLDHYDDHGRRRVLPSDQKWSSSSWKHLADAQYKDRMFLIDKHERRTLHETLQNERVLAEKDASVFMEHTESIQGILAGVIDTSPDQAYQAIAGTSDPAEVADVKRRTSEYQALSFTKAIRGNPEDMDPVTGLPKSNMPPLPSGLTLEEAAVVASTVAIADDELQFQSLSNEVETGKSGIANHLAQSLKVGKSKDKPMLTALAEEKIEQIKHKKEQLSMLAEHRKALEEVERETIKSLGEGGGGVVEEKTTTSTAQQQEEDDWVPIDPSIAQDPSTTISRAPNTTTTAPSSAASTSRQQRESGFIPIPKGVSSSKEGKSVALPPNTLKDAPRQLNEIPEWYQQQAIDTQPMIMTYGLTNDPIEKQYVAPASRDEESTANKPSSNKKRSSKRVTTKRVVSSFHEMPEHDEEASVSGDKVTLGVSSFDDQRVFDETMNAESSGQKAFSPLPVYRELSGGMEDELQDITEFGNQDTTKFIKAVDLGTTEDGENRVATIPDRKKDIYKSRQERAASRRLTNAYDPDLLLPDLPWETDSVLDPYRGVAEKDAIPFHRETILSVWNTYRGSVRQMMAEIVNFAKEGTQEAIDKMMRDSMERLRKGEVGDHVEASPEIVSMVRNIFEANLVFFEKEVILSGRDSVEATRLTARADELNRQGLAKAKMLGPTYVNFITEMSSLEVDGLKENPLRRRSVVAHVKNIDKFVQPFVKWVQRDLEPYKCTSFDDPNQIQVNDDVLAKALSLVLNNAPHDHTVNQDIRKQVTMGCYHWARGVLAYTTGSHYMRLMRHTGEVGFRGQAEESYNLASEYFQGAFSQTNKLVSLPVPNSEPSEQYSDKEFPLTNPLNAEAFGDFDRADEAWGVGSTKRWYGSVDETEFALYLERRGRFQSSMDAADRTMEYMQKKTHPSIHPFPDRARLWLEDAPLTQETAEHLWLRHMATIYLTFASLHTRQLRLKTAGDLRKKGLNCLSTAVGAAKERLPTSWRAPLLTKVIYMCNSFDTNCDPHLFIKDAEYLVDQMYTMKEKTRHWIEPVARLHYRVFIFQAIETAYAMVAHQIARQKTQTVISDQTLMMSMQLRMEGRSTDHIAGLAKYDAALQTALDHIYRDKIRKYMALESPHSESYVALTHLYFNFRVRVKDEEEIEKLWKMYAVTWEAIYTQSCFGESLNGTDKLDEGLKYLCHISFYGNQAQKERLLEQLVRVRDKLNHLVAPNEIDRCILSVEKNIEGLKAGKVDRTSEEGSIYVYSLKTSIENGIELRKILSNPLLSMKNSEESNYDAQQKRLHDINVGN